MNDTRRIDVNFSWLGLLGIVFVTLKLTGVIDWSWWWVTLPFWFGLALAAIIGAILFIGFVIVASADTNNKRKRGRK
jgi:hypothetical protein